MSSIYSFVTRIASSATLWWMIGATLLSGCEIPPDNVTPQPSDSAPNVPSSNSAMVTITGEITEVMESWPLQLVVVVQSQQYDVALEADTSITQHGQDVTAGDLSPGQRVRITGTSASPGGGLIAQTIEIL